MISVVRIIDIIDKSAVDGTHSVYDLFGVGFA
jgi:hypothetical protein